MKTIQCPKCHGMGLVEETNARGEITREKCHGMGLVEETNARGEITRDDDGNSFYTECRRCHIQGEIEVDDDWEEGIDDREGEDDYRKEDTLHNIET